MTETARVVMLRGSGSERLRDAIAAGLAEGDLRRDIEQVLAENDRIRVERDQLRRERDSLRAVVREYTKAHSIAYRERIERNDVWRGNRNYRLSIGLAIGMLSSMVTIALFMTVMLRT